MFAYIIRITKPSRSVYYTGITNSIKRRYRQHLMGIGSKWAKRYFKSNKYRTKKELVYVEFMQKGVNWVKRGKQIKRMSPKYKEKLINSDNNLLISYIIKHIGVSGVDVNIKLKGF